MKITCPYCGSLFNDTLEHCPNCGAVNSRVVRKSGDQPVTIEELQQWYQDRGLPPAKVTRFFIGVDYKEPRAFGIYKDSQTGNFVVYKNKDTGQRAIRYEGSDEAYAVNELFQRLKQEIIEQKMNNVKKAQHSNSSNTSEKNNSSCWKDKDFLFCILCPVIVFGFCIALIFKSEINTALNNAVVAPKEGYYNYDNTVYYASREKYSADGTVNLRHWFSYDKDTSDWSKLLTKEQIPKDLRRKASAKEYYLSRKWDDSIGATNFLDSTSYEDLKKSFNVRTGYYKNGDTTLYHLTDFAYDNWYYYDTDTSNWTSIDASKLPDDILRPTSSDDFFYTATWDSSTQVTDFKYSGAYYDYKAAEQRANTKDNSSYSKSSRSSDYDWSSSDSWDSGSTDWSSDW